MKKRTMRKWLALAWLLYTMLMLTAVGLIISIALPLTPPMARSTAPTHPLTFTPGLASMTVLILLLLIVVQALLVGTTAWFLQRSILTPLDAIGKASKQIEQGNLHFSLPSSSTLEMAEVVSAFNAMGQALRDALARQEKLEEERRFFISAVVHDLRTPLFSLRGYLEGVEKGVADTPEMVAQYLQICRGKAEDLEHLITDLFTYTRLEYLELLPQREEVDMGVLLQKTVEAMRPLAERAGIMVTITCEGSSPSSLLAVDRRLLVRAIENLLENAIRYTPQRGSIAINWLRKPERFEFTIADTGPGIAPQDLPHVFKPLHRGETSRNRQTGGTGLGLTIAQQIFQAHGGDLSAANRESGGAVFRGFLLASRNTISGTKEEAHSSP
ncbi:sensor histidine kinase [Ktedonobacter racemifer]|uniref:histidine kinase n=1 Tax=Ktedonobacter racemifer DSM 44963 TaxID=485913 RepID=D6TT58_KTERA|nr:HAMP domain-containing sensor histidine kinase [Ktedonobacter racemifer]EFH83609.1 integral membrane sensor signal transduction histidine kinase [Ktedonobacter racemifer DSM 44963]